MGTKIHASTEGYAYTTILNVESVKKSGFEQDSGL